MEKKTLLSASVPTGNLTIGNYIGAISNWALLQEKYHCLYPVADLHAITVPQVPQDLHSRSLSFLAQYLALGLDSNKNIIFMQSHVSAHAELAWVLNCFCSMGTLSRMTQFKDKAKESRNAPAGLFTYPTLMAADILLYQTHIVPTGQDQKQHLELTRDIAQNFNKKYGKTFVVPEPHIGKVGARIMSLQDVEKKMSKSDSNPKNYIAVLDEPSRIVKKIKSAVTDSGSEIKYDTNNKPLANLMTIYSAITQESMEKIEQDFQGKMYGHFKKELADRICDALQPIQKKYTDLMKNKDYLEGIVRSNADKARTIANKTLADVYEKVGFFPRS